MKWISVKDKLPEKSTDVLLWMKEKPFSYIGASYVTVGKLYDHRDVYNCKGGKNAHKCKCIKNAEDPIYAWTVYGTPLFWMPIPNKPDDLK